MSRALIALGARVLTALAVLLVAAASARADVFRPAYLELREAGDGRYDVLWKVPAPGEELRLPAFVRFPEDTLELTAAARRTSTAAPTSSAGGSGAPAVSSGRRCASKASPAA